MFIIHIFKISDKKLNTFDINELINGVSDDINITKW